MAVLATDFLGILVLSLNKSWKKITKDRHIDDIVKKLGGPKIDIFSELSAYSDNIAELCDEAFLEEPRNKSNR